MKSLGNRLIHTAALHKNRDMRKLWNHEPNCYGIC